jgi:hypothetical protein
LLDQSVIRELQQVFKLTQEHRRRPSSAQLVELYYATARTGANCLFFLRERRGRTTPNKQHTVMHSRMMVRP